MALVTMLNKPVREEDEELKVFVRGLKCLVCEFGSTDAVAQHMKTCDWLNSTASERQCDPHHIRKGANSGTGTKPSDAGRLVPLSRTAHDEHDRIGHNAFEKRYGLDLLVHAQRIYRQFAYSRPSKSKVERARTIKADLNNGVPVKRLKAWAVVNKLGNIQGVFFSKAKPHSSERVVRVEIREAR